MAKIKLSLGDRAAALFEAEAAYSLRPQQPEFRQLRDELSAPVPPVSE
jgi:hypothetical protein